MTTNIDSRDQIDPILQVTGNHLTLGLSMTKQVFNSEPK
jgi:hypothetical protein